MIEDGSDVMAIDRENHSWDLTVNSLGDSKVNIQSGLSDLHKPQGWSIK